VSGGLRTAYVGNWHVTFTKFAFAKVAADITNGSSTTATFSVALPSSVVVGSFAMGVDRTSNPVFDPAAKDRATVTAIAGDRLSCTFSSALNLDRTITAANFDGILFMPQLWSGQIWCREPFSGMRVNAVRVSITMPSQPNYTPGAAFTKAQVEAAYSAASAMLWGFWPAVWLYSVRSGPQGDGLVTIPGGQYPWCEIDIYEGFNRFSHGPKVWSGNLFNQAFSRSTSNAISGSAWLTQTADARNLSENAVYLTLATLIASGSPISLAVVWTKNKVVHYINDIPVAESFWTKDSDYPMQLGLNVACGSITANNCASLFFPQTDAQATGQFMKVHRIESWEH
jgi:hypothetical protein